MRLRTLLPKRPNDLLRALRFQREYRQCHPEKFPRYPHVPLGVAPPDRAKPPHRTKVRKSTLNNLMYLIDHGQTTMEDTDIELAKYTYRGVDPISQHVVSLKIKDKSPTHAV